MISYFERKKPDFRSVIFLLMTFHQLIQEDLWSWFSLSQKARDQMDLVCAQLLFLSPEVN